MKIILTFTLLILSTNAFSSIKCILGSNPNYSFTMPSYSACEGMISGSWDSAAASFSNASTTYTITDTTGPGGGLSCSNSVAISISGGGQDAGSACMSRASDGAKFILISRAQVSTDPCDCSDSDSCEYLAREDQDTCFPDGPFGGQAVDTTWGFNNFNPAGEGGCPAYDAVCEFDDGCEFPQIKVGTNQDGSPICEIVTDGGDGGGDGGDGGGGGSGDGTTTATGGEIDNEVEVLEPEDTSDTQADTIADANEVEKEILKESQEQSTELRKHTQQLSDINDELNNVSDGIGDINQGLDNLTETVADGTKAALITEANGAVTGLIDQYETDYNEDLNATFTDGNPIEASDTISGLLNSFLPTMSSCTDINMNIFAFGTLSITCNLTSPWRTIAYWFLNVLTAIYVFKIATRKEHT